MDITITAIDRPTLLARKDTLHLTRFDIDFVSDNASGRAFLWVLHSSTEIDLKRVRQECVGRTQALGLSVNDAYDFQVLEGHGRDQIVPLGSPGAFSLEGRIVQHLISGEGSLFQVANDLITLEVDMLPPDS